MAARPSAIPAFFSPVFGTKTRIDSGYQALNTQRAPLKFLSV